MAQQMQASQYQAVPMQVRPQSNKSTPPALDVDAKIKALTGVTAYALWAELLALIVRNRIACKTSTLCDFLSLCPRSFRESSRDLRKELVERYQNEIVIDKLTRTNDLAKCIRQFDTLLTLANFCGRVMYLKERAVVYTAFATAGIPADIQKRIQKCETWNLQKAGRYTSEELSMSGYEQKTQNVHQEVWVHPVSRESMTVSLAKAGNKATALGGVKLTGGALLSADEKEKRRLANEAKRIECRNNRRGNKKIKKVEVPKDDSDKSQKGKNGKRTKGK